MRYSIQSRERPLLSNALFANIGGSQTILISEHYISLSICRWKLNRVLATVIINYFVIDGGDSSGFEKVPSDGTWTRKCITHALVYTCTAACWRTWTASTQHLPKHSLCNTNLHFLTFLYICFICFYVEFLLYTQFVNLYANNLIIKLC